MPPEHFWGHLMRERRGLAGGTSSVKGMRAGAGELVRLGGGGVTWPRAMSLMLRERLNPGMLCGCGDLGDGVLMYNSGQA